MKSFKELIESSEKHLGTHDPFEDVHGVDEFSSHKDGMELHKRPDRHFTEDEHKALHQYSQSSYKDVNHILRNTSDWKKMRNGDDYIHRRVVTRTNRDLKHFKENYIPHMDSAISEHTTEHHATVWRGMNKHIISKLNLKNNKVVTDKGYSSTSLRPFIARKFGRNDDGTHLAKIHLPKGSKALYMNQSKLSSNSSENEVILPRNSKFRYEGSTTHENPENEPGYTLSPITVHHFTHIPEESS